MLNELWLDKINDGEDINLYLDELQKYIFTPNLFSKRKDEICTIHQGKHKRELTLGRMLVSCYFLRILSENKIKLQLEYFFDKDDATELNGYIDYISRIFKEKNSNLQILKQRILDGLTKLSDDMIQVNSLKGATLSLYDIIELQKRNERFNELTNLTIPDGMDLNEIEQFVNKNVEEAIKILCEEDTAYRDLIRGKAISNRQLGQSLVNIGLKPDIDGNVIPEPINTSFIRGLRGRKDYYTCAIGARKAMLINFKQVKASGYLTRKLQLLVIKTKLSDEEACDTVHTVGYTIDNENSFKRFIGKVMDNGHIIEASDKDTFVKKDKDGKIIPYTFRVYSPITCNCKTGICRRCYGKLSEVTEEFHTGIVSVLLLTVQLTQMLLSSKHLLMAKTKKIDWPEDFQKAFYLDKDCIYPSTDTTKIIIDPAYVFEDDEDDTYVTVIGVKVGSKTFTIRSPKELFFVNPEDINQLQKETTPFQIKPEQNAPIFRIKTRNIELNTALQALIDLLQKADHDGHGNNYEAIANGFINKLNESNLEYGAVHAEVIIYCLLKALNGERPDFSKEDIGEFTVGNIRESILNDDSLAVSLAFEQIKKQLNSPATYSKHAEGIFDSLFI